MLTPDSTRWLDRVRAEIDQARRALEVERDRLIAERAALGEQIATLDQEMQVLARMETQSNAASEQASAAPMPLSHRVLSILRSSPTHLTSRQMREQLHLDYRESRNLGPVLHQLMKSGRVANDGRGAPWRLMS